MRISNYIILILITFQLSGCCLNGDHDVFYEFNTDEISWQIYKINDTLVFKNQFDSINKYIITSIRKDSIPEDTENLFRCKINHLLIIQIDFSKIINDTTSSIASGSFYMDKSSNSFNISINFEGTWKEIYGSRVNDNIEDTITIDGIKYTDIFICDVDTTRYPFKLNRLYYSKTKGLIRYIAMNEDIWTRKF